MTTEKQQPLIAPPLDMSEHFKGRIQCGRCGNSNSSKFTYMLPFNGSVMVKCECGNWFFKDMEPSQQK